MHVAKAKSEFNRKDETESRFPNTHPLWSKFVEWVSTSGIVRRDLLECHPGDPSKDDWKLIWVTWGQGYQAGYKLGHSDANEE